MDSHKPHAICIPYPAQGHINPMLKVAKLLHQQGFYITFVNTHFNHRRLIKSHGIQALSGLPDFRFASIPDGLPPSDADATQDIPSLCKSTTTTCLEPFCELIHELNKEKKVDCIVSDGVMSFTLRAAERFRLPEVLLWTTSACGLLGYMYYQRLIDEGITPLKDIGQLSNGFLDTVVDWFPAVKGGGLRLKDFPTFIRTTDPDDIMLNFVLQETEALKRASGILLNTFDALEEDVIAALQQILPPIYTIGPLNLSLNRIPDGPVKSIGSSLWKEESECLKWLDNKKPASVLYINFGSITVATPEQLTEFAWGLANSGSPFLWVIRPDIVFGESAMLPEAFLQATKDRGVLASWISQEEVLGHAAIGGFLTHSGWNSAIESISSGVPMICWPFFAEQQTNCRFSCVEWGVGLEIDSDVKREDVETLVRELMEGKKGKKIKEAAAKWRNEAAAAAASGGSSDVNLHRVIKEVLWK